MKNIFFFWDKDIPEVYKKHISEMQQKWSDYRVHLIDDDFILDYYTKHDCEFRDIYKKISLGAAKADLVRLLLMYNYGGLFMDIMNYPKEHFIDMGSLFTNLKNKTTYVGSWEPENISFQVILSKPKSDLMLKLYELCKNNLLCQYDEEINKNNKKGYNLVSLTGPILFHDVVVNKPFERWNTYLSCSENDEKNRIFFAKWDCDLINVENYFWLWRVGFDNHHGINMDKHWSKLQLKQTLFYL